MSSSILDLQLTSTLTSTTCLVASKIMLLRDGGFNTFIENSGELPGSQLWLDMELVAGV